ncbi:sugar/nucleoside kinase (ribokinase family) [Williamsia limnetica]|uniref:Sugar/nucleoside kinase (Ribokinase family) n=1 Tax=Williamsia limnetica TaxID=882452 RepID=A0A318RQN5_WILLI|nr:carbohydrate kinase family protein [Williamsia limnetica]PYE17596.1 sugar/nucleoside kinase (ribokinase family) [Williamsia limnetica]
MQVVTFGAHVLDVVVHPVDEIPEGQGAVLVPHIRLVPAGPAGGTAITLAKLGAAVSTVGALGRDDSGDLLITQLQRHGVVTEHLLRVDDQPTSMSVLPIRTNGDRPALHLPGANLAYPLDQVPIELLTSADHVHIGAPELLGPAELAPTLERIRAAGVTISADILAPGDPGVLAWIEAVLPHLDYLLPNDEQVLGLTGATDLIEGCRTLIDRGVGCVAVTAGADGAWVVTAAGAEHAAATAVEVVDTSGCGDAFSAGFIAGRLNDFSALRAAQLGCAVAGVVATGLGSDHGDFDWTSATESLPD